jgi:hypothetical protein
VITHSPAAAIDRAARGHFTGTPVYLATVLQNSVLPARVTLTYGPTTVRELGHDAYRAEFQVSIAEEQIPGDRLPSTLTYRHESDRP